MQSVFAQTKDFEQAGDKTEQADKKKEEEKEKKPILTEFQKQVIKIHQLIEKRVTNPTQREISINLLQTDFFSHESTEIAAWNVITESGMVPPADLEKLIQQRETELEKAVDELTRDINEKGNDFNKDGKYTQKEQGNLTDKEKMKIWQGAEEVYWLERFGVLDNPQLKDKYLQSQLGQIGEDVKEVQDFLGGQTKEK